MSADSPIPTDEQIEREHARRRRLASSPPFRNPLPATVAELLAECEKHRAPLVAAMRDGNLAGPLTGFPKALFIPPFERLWQAATALDMPDVPPFPGKPVTALECVAALDTLRVWCQSKQQRPTSASPEPSSEQPPAKSKRGGGRKGLADSNPLKANLYILICREHKEGEEGVDTVARLKQRRDIVTLAGKAGVKKIDTKLVRNALAWEWQRLYRERQKLPDNETDGTPLYDSDD